MSLGTANEKYGKVFLVAASLIVGLAILLAFKVYGYDSTWKLWRVPVMHPQFADFRLIPGSAESFRRGFEPTRRNPGDPTGRIFNYPAFWRLFFYTGITQNDTVWIVLVMLGLFFVSVFLFPQDLTILGSLAMLFVIFSPAAMLLYERGNVDIFVFFLCAVIVLSMDYSPYLTSLFLIFATVVKLYPFFGVAVLFKGSKSEFIKLSLVCFGALVAYVYITSKSVSASWNLTQRGNDISYGATVIFQRYGQYFSSLFGVLPTSPLLKYGFMVLAFTLVAIAGIFGLASHERLTSSSARNLAAFRMGASIYVGTFLLGNNWDYRLAFLIFIMPQILQWSGPTTNKLFKKEAIAVLILTLLSCWHFILWYEPRLSSGRELIFIIDEFINWTLLVKLSYLLLASTPAWVKEQYLLLAPKRLLFMKSAE